MKYIRALVFAAIVKVRPRDGIIQHYDALLQR